MNRRILILGAVAAAAAALFVLKPWEKDDPVSNKLTVGYSKLRISLPVFVAQKKGYFTEQGLEVSLQSFDTAQPLMDALVAGHVDAGGFTAYPITFKAMQVSGKSFYFAGAMLEDQEHPISMLLRKKGSGIASVADLKGKRIGILPTNAYKAWLEMVLKKNNIQPSEVTIVQVAPPMTVSSFENGTIDAAFTNDPAATASVKKGVAEMITTEALVPKYLWSPYPFGSFNMTKDLTEGKPEVAQKLAAALDKAIAYTNDNPQEAEAILKEFLPPEQNKIIEDFADARYAASKDVTAEEMAKLVQSFVELGVLEKPLDLGPLIFRAK
jgi:NitT/TauT family transport system substrate-binding protein